MPLVLNGDGNIAGLTAGGLPDATITQSELAVNVAGNGPAFSVYSSASQSLSNNTDVKVQWNNEEFDTNNNFDSTTNYRFTPTVAGYYSFFAECNYSTNNSGSRFLTLKKNGSSIKGFTLTGVNSTNYSVATVSALVYLNGSTDYVEVFASQNSGSTLSTGGSASEVYFFGYMVRSA